MKSKKSSRFKLLPFSSSSVSTSSLSSSSRHSIPIAASEESKNEVRLLSVKRKSSIEDSGWESSPPSSTSSSSISSRKSFSSSSSFFKLFHRSAATLLLPTSRADEEPHRHHTNVFFKNEDLDLDSLPPSNKQTSFVAKARRRSSKLRLQEGSLSVLNLKQCSTGCGGDYGEGSSVISGCTSSTLTTASISPLRRHSISSLLSSRTESAKEASLEYDSGAYSRTSSPADEDLLRASTQHLAISAPLSAPSLVLAACSSLYHPDGDDEQDHRVSVTIGSHTRLSVSRGRCPLLGTAGLSPSKRGLLNKSSSPSRLTRSKISTVYLGRTPTKTKTTSSCSCGEQVTVNGRHHCSSGDESRRDDKKCLTDDEESCDSLI